MKRSILSATFCLLAAAESANAAIVVPGANGTDGVLNITQDTVIDLSRATTGVWDQDNTANAGNGVYDADKWAVVFKSTSGNVLGGKQLTFKNHALRAPVVRLVSGSVTISGAMDLSGGSADNHSVATEEELLKLLTIPPKYDTFDNRNASARWEEIRGKIIGASPERYYQPIIDVFRARRIKF